MSREISSSSPGIVRAATALDDPERAAAELALALGDSVHGAVVFFCAPSYDLDALGRALRARIDGTLVGCTGAGLIGPRGYQRAGVVALGLARELATVHAHRITPLREGPRQAAALAERITAELRAEPRRRAFGLLLADGLSLAEERLTAALYESLGDVPIVGGSAADDLEFAHTWVFDGERFVEDTAMFVVVATDLPFEVVKLEHYVPTRRRLVITEAEPHRRLVRGINGRVAAEAYAELIGVGVDELVAGVFSRHPLMQRIGGDFYVRAIRNIEPDGSMAFFCAMEVGLVLTIGESVGELANVRAGFDAIPADSACVLGCDCVLRRLEFEQRGILGGVGDVLADHRVLGFSTYGEQFNGVHVNQTFVGVALGAARS